MAKPEPTKPPAWRRPIDALASLKPVAAFLRRTLHHLDRPLMRLSRGRLATTRGLPTLLLTTTGRKTGQRRSAPLLYVATPSGPAVIGTHFGSTRHPAWYLNLQADPRAEVLVDGRQWPVVARPALPAERQDIWKAARALYPGYEKYRDRVGARTIPILVLENQGR